MENRNGTKWNREETILAFELYCRTPFGKINQKNPDIIELSKLLGRTPSAVGLKMANLAHYDPKMQKRDIMGMAHGSKLDEQIYMEFANSWTELVYQAVSIKAEMKHMKLNELIDIGDVENIPPGTYRKSVVKTRVGQHFFRNTVLSSYGNRCCITGIEKSELLIASHIKPWRVCNDSTEKTNPRNGLCLNSLHDKAFDKGLITVDKTNRIVISPALRESEMDEDTKRWFMGYSHKEITLPEKFLPDPIFLEYHNDVVFQHG